MDITSEEYIARLQTFADTILKEDENRGAAIWIWFLQLSPEKVYAFHDNAMRRMRNILYLWWIYIRLVV